MMKGSSNPSTVHKPKSYHSSCLQSHISRNLMMGRPAIAIPSLEKISALKSRYAVPPLTQTQSNARRKTVLDPLIYSATKTKENYLQVSSVHYPHLTRQFLTAKHSSGHVEIPSRSYLSCKVEEKTQPLLLTESNLKHFEEYSKICKGDSFSTPHHPIEDRPRRLRHLACHIPSRPLHPPGLFSSEFHPSYNLKNALPPMTQGSKTFNKLGLGSISSKPQRSVLPITLTKAHPHHHVQSVTSALQPLSRSKASPAVKSSLEDCEIQAATIMEDKRRKQGSSSGISKKGKKILMVDKNKTAMPGGDHVESETAEIVDDKTVNITIPAISNNEANNKEDTEENVTEPEGIRKVPSASCLIFVGEDGEQEATIDFSQDDNELEKAGIYTRDTKSPESQANLESMMMMAEQRMNAFQELLDEHAQIVDEISKAEKK